MHFSTATLATLFLSSSVLAGPIWGPGHGGDDDRKNKEGKGWDNDKDKDRYKEYDFSQFKNVYTVKAYPDQVVSGQGTAAVPAPGEPGAKGFFKFGINVHKNTICYVSSSIKHLASILIRQLGLTCRLGMGSRASCCQV